MPWITTDDLDLDDPSSWDEDAVAAANAWAFKARKRVGYTDDPDDAPDDDVKAGTVMYARLLIATEGSQSGSAHFDALDVGTAGAIGGDMREVRRLLGVLNVKAWAVG